MSENPVRRDDHGPVVVLTLNRPDRRNALSRPLVTALSDALDRLTVESGPRVLVLAGAGPTFCAGMDLKEAMERGPDGADEEGVVKDIQAIADLISQLHRFPRPTIAALDGDALAGGAGLAMACDFVLARAGARVGYPEVRRGMVAAIVLHDLVRQVGDRRARELLLTGEPIGAEQAERWGLINRVVPGESCLPAALELARALLGSAPQALATTKQLIDEATGRPADLRGAAAVSAAVRVADEAGEGIRAFLEKRPPLWTAGPSPSRIAGDRRRDAGIDIHLQNSGARDPGPAPGA